MSDLDFLTLASEIEHLSRTATWTWIGALALLGLGFAYVTIRWCRWRRKKKDSLFSRPNPNILTDPEVRTGVTLQETRNLLEGCAKNPPTLESPDFWSGKNTRRR